MKRWQKVFPFLMCCVCTAGSAVAAEKTPPGRLLFEQYGPSDATLMPFTIAVGPTADSTREIVFVMQETYESVFAEVKRASGGPQSGPAPSTFQVTAYKNEKPEAKYIIYSSTLISVMRTLRQMFMIQHQRVPEWIAVLEKIMPACQ